jgi:hypothetical protein
MTRGEENLLRACAQLGVTPDAVANEVQITPHLKAIAAVIRRAGQPRITTKIETEKGDYKAIKTETEHVPPYGPGSDVARSWPWYLQTSDHPEAKKVLSVYFSTFKIHRRVLSIEAYCVAAHVPPLRILEIITATCVRLGAQASNIVAAVNHPRVVQKTVEMALTDEGVEDRAMLHKAAGFLPTPKGAQTNITIAANAQSNSLVQAALAPPPEQTIRRMVNRFNESKQLPQESGVVVRIPEVMPHEEIEENEAALVNAINGDADEEEEAELNP